MSEHKTPGMPNQGAVRPSDDNLKLDQEEHLLCGSGVGMLLLCLVKHSRPDLATVTCELSKALDGLQKLL
jgi:hypothetical protein